MIQVLIAIDQLFNAIFGGMADETISARAYRQAIKGKKRWVYAEKFINALFFWEADHCYMSYLAEINRRQLPFEYMKD